VNGEESAQAYRADDTPRPEGLYALSKWRGEQGVWRSARGTALHAAVVRAPLVYGPGVRANFLRLLHWVDIERPLPFGAVHNRRSLVSVWTLSDLLLRLLTHEAAPNRTWMVSDGEDVSTPDLLGRLAQRMGRRARLLRVPPPLLSNLAALIGRKGEIRRLCGSLYVDISTTRELLGWSPLMTLDDALTATVSWYRSRGQE
jgi:nucleoside-diphosphate-sugar epimerase